MTISAISYGGFFRIMDWIGLCCIMFNLHVQIMFCQSSEIRTRFLITASINLNFSALHWNIMITFHHFTATRGNLLREPMRRKRKAGMLYECAEYFVAVLPVPPILLPPPVPTTRHKFNGVAPQ